MPVDPTATLDRGGQPLVDFLQFGLVSARPEPVFLALVRDYRVRPTAVGALALFDQFCAAGAPARVSADAVLPPRDPTFGATVAPIRAAVARAAAFRPTEDAPDPPPVPIPAAYLFDRVVAEVAAEVADLAARLDPEKGPIGSLPGGRISQGHRAWVENVWRKSVRPALVAAGFRRVAPLGQP